MRLVSYGVRVFSINAMSLNALALPKRFKGTLVEKLTNYWKGLLIDYKDVAFGLVRGSRQKPQKAAIYIIGGFVFYKCGKQTPNEEDFHKQFRLASNDLNMVHPSLQNPQSSAFVRRLQTDLNQNRLRFLSLGIFTVLWEDIYDKEDCTYAAQCEYTQVNQWNFLKHVVDIGFWNNFWRLKYELYNYDINYL